MAVIYASQKCDRCAGKLQYIKDKKIWECMYCGAQIVREEQYDGLFTIKNVVRQSLLDTSYRRLESAQKNVLECEKIDARYVGTLIAKIAHEMITVITPGACSDRDARNIFAQLKKNYELLKSQSTNISDDEEALYEYLEEADIYATLILVFDSLNDVSRRDFVASLLNAKEVYSKDANNNLLSYAIKNKQFEMVDDIISNADNVDVKAALASILTTYPEGDRKSANVERLYGTGAIKPEDRQIVENYISTSVDSKQTKAAVAISSLKCGMRLGLEGIIDNVLTKAETDQVRAVVTQLCTRKLSDEEVLRLVDYGFSSGSAEIAVAVLDCLKQGGQFLLIPSKLLISLLGMNTYTSEEKVRILNKCFEFRIDNKSIESVVTNYLCYNASPAQDRKPILSCLFEKTGTFPTATVETYVLKSNADGSNKPEIIAAMFDKGLNASFFRDLLSKYMGSNTDDSETKSNVVRVLTDRGLKIDPLAFTDYVCSSSDTVQEKINFVKKMINNGSQLRGDAANTYLERTAPANFSAELFTTLFLPGSTFSAKAIEKYLLSMKDREANKLSNLKSLIDHSNSNVADLNCLVTHLDNTIECNILQAYVLTTTDTVQLAESIADYFVSQMRLKINEEISVSGNSMKLKKYVASNKEKLSGVTNAICEKYKVYSMLF